MWGGEFARALDKADGGNRLYRRLDQ
ncbi:hypothetical protein RSAG8_07456, partial [Rhizoctonia solani AG-8 WAC10335]